jgi:hypothetical protein
MSGTDWVISPGTTLTYDTALGPVSVKSLTIHAGGTLRVYGVSPFVLLASKSVIVEGLLSGDGFDAQDVSTLGTGSQPQLVDCNG